MGNLTRFSALLLAAIAVYGCATSPTGRNQLMLVSPEQAIYASREAYQQTLLPLAKEGRLDNNPAATRRVQEVTGRIVAQAIQQYPHTRNWDWSVRVIDDPNTVNAWCMAGGKMAVYSGLLTKLDPTDDELAQVMGHEVAHAIANHTAEKMSTAMATQMGLLGVAAVSNNSAYRDSALSGAALAAAYAIELPNSRTAETEADVIGIELAARAGYDPRAAISLWDKMARVGGSRPPEFLSTHPDPYNRQRQLARMVPDMMPYYRAEQPRPVYRFR